MISSDFRLYSYLITIEKMYNQEEDSHGFTAISTLLY